MRSAFSCELRYRARTIPSVRFCANPSGPTSTNLAVKSVSTAEDLAKSSSWTGPVTSRSCSSEKQKEVKVDASNLFTFDNRFVLTGDAVESGKHTLQVRKKGVGPVY